MSGDFIPRLAITLLHFLWQATALGGIVVLLQWTMRRRTASSRYLLYAAAMLVLPLLLIATFCTVAVPAHWTAAATEPTVEDEAGKPQPSPREGLVSDPIEPFDRSPISGEALGAPTETSSPRAQTPTVGEAKPAWFARMAAWIVWAYVLGACCFTSRLALGIWGGHRLRTDASEIKDSRLRDLVVERSKRLGLSIVPRVAACERVTVPTVLGLLRPVILLPTSLLTGLNPTQAAAIISHELAHIRRHDLWLNLLQRVTESLLFFHPVVWHISRRMSAEREACCDDLVIASGYDRAHYADALLRMAEVCRFREKSRAVGLAAAGTRPTELEQRIARLLGGNMNPHLQLSRLGVLALVFATLSMVALPSVVHRWVHAQETPRTADSDANEPPGEDSASKNVEQPKIDKESDVKSESLAEAVRRINDEIKRHPVATTVKPLTAEMVIAKVKLFDKEHIAKEDGPAIARLLDEGMLAENVSLRHFVRYATEEGMRHGSWVRLIVRRKNSGPLGILIRDETVFERPYTQQEREFRHSVMESGGMPTLGRLVTWFDADPQHGKSPAPTADYSTLVTAAKAAVESKSDEDFLKLFHFQGVKGDTLKKFIRHEFQQLLKRPIARITFERRQFLGSPRQRLSFEEYGPNLKVEGYLKFQFKKAEPQEPKSLQLEAGSSDGRPLLACHIVTKDESKKFLGKRLSGPISTGPSFMFALPDGAFETGDTITAPDEFKHLRRANSEIWRRHISQFARQAPGMKRVPGPPAGSAAVEKNRPTVVWSSQARDGWLAGVRVEHVGAIAPGKPATVRYLLKNTTGRSREVRLARFHKPHVSLSAENRLTVDFFHDTGRHHTVTLQPGGVLDDARFQIEIDTTGLENGVYHVGASSAFLISDENDKTLHHGIPIRGLATLRIGAKAKPSPPAVGPIAKDSRDQIQWGKPVAGLMVGARWRERRDHFYNGQDAVADLFLYNATDKAIECDCLLPHPADGWLFNVWDREGNHVQMNRVMLSIPSIPQFMLLTLKPGEQFQLTGAPAPVTVTRDRTDLKRHGTSKRDPVRYWVATKDTPPRIPDYRFSGGRMDPVDGFYEAAFRITMLRGEKKGVKLQLTSGKIPFQVGTPKKIAAN